MSCRLDQNNPPRKAIPEQHERGRAYEGDQCIAGQTYNLAGLLAQVGYSDALTVDRLISLAAYMLLVAQSLDPLCVSGSDIAVCRDAVGRFEFVPSDEITAAASKLESGIRQVIAG